MLAALAAVSVAGTAHAADLHTKALPQPIQYVNYDPFSGPYVGVNVGYGWDLGNASAAFQAVPIANLSAAPQGFVGGFQAGYGYRFANVIYAGLEGDVDGANITGSATMPGLITTNSKNSWLASIRGEFGIIPVGHALLYGTVGWGWGGGSFTVQDLTGRAALNASASPTMDGFVWGGGVKFPLAQNWILGVKYLQYDFGSFNAAAPAMPGLVFTQKDRVDVVRAELNYKF